MIRATGVFALLFLLGAAHAQHRSDPLTSPEVDQLRDQAQEPDLRLKLYVQFARKRLEAIEKLRSNPKAADRGKSIHDGLQDFLDVYDELDQNVDTFQDRGADFRKALKLIIDADIEFEAKLRAMKDAMTAEQEESRIYELLLQTALDTVSGSVKDHRDLLTDQEQAAKHKKKPR